MDEEAALLRAICEQPREDTPRLAFADWLDEQGGDVRAVWAELIRVQVPLGYGAGAERDRLLARERELMPVLSAEWPAFMGFPGALAWQNWTRGFPLTVAGPGERIRAAYPRFAARVPLREFNIRSASDADVVALSGWPEARLVQKLGVWTDSAQQPIGEGAFVTFVQSEQFAELERLRLEYVRLTERAAVAFLDSPLAANLRNVKLRSAVGLAQLGYDTRQRITAAFGQYDVS